MRQNSRTRCHAPAMRLIAAAVLAAFCLDGCTGARYAAGPDYAPGEHDYLRADVTAAYSACVAVCSADTSLALVTRTGCLEGCEEARRAFPLTDKAYASRKECLDALLEQELTKDARIREMWRMCDAKWTHLHNRKGCHIAAEAFYANLTPASVCGSDGVEAAAYDLSLAKAREEGSRTPEPARPQPPLSPQESPASEPEPRVLPPAAPGSTGPPLAAEPPAVSPTADPVGEPTRGTQPAGPLIPPPYVPEDGSPALSGPAAAPSAHGPGIPPAIHDTPKYQKPAPRKPAVPDEPASRNATVKTGDPPPATTPAAPSSVDPSPATPSSPQGIVPPETSGSPVAPGDVKPGPAASPTTPPADPARLSAPSTVAGPPADPAPTPPPSEANKAPAAPARTGGGTEPPPPPHAGAP
ncbi:MAG: hypothetical protein LIP28_05075, partial [Deltaproteobacteria bacterium]|nr:hypothetical protein [Deltaproteobacteria bacterium]